MPKINPTLERMQSGTQMSMGEKIDWTYYDTVTIANAIARHRMFTVALGGGVPAKTLAETNMLVQGLLPQGHKLFTKALKVFYTAPTGMDSENVQMIYDWIEKTTIEIKPSGKDSLGTWKLIELFGSPLQIAVIPTVPGDNIQQNQSRVVGIMPLNKTLILAALASFEVSLETHFVQNAELDGARFTLGLNGQLDRLS
jgi:hypothetical protein